MRHLSAKHAGIACVLFIYFMAMFYLVPVFAPALLDRSPGNTAIYFAVTYGIATVTTFVSRLIYVPDVGFKFELLAGLVVAFVFFVVIGQPRLKII